MKKQQIKNIIVFVVIIFIFTNGFFQFDYFLPTILFINNLIFLFIIIVLLLFNFIVRRFISFKPYFTNKFNILCSKYHKKHTYDIPKELLFEKLIEVVKNSGFKLKKSDKLTYNIFATAPISWWSWGQNIYISLNNKNDNTEIDFYSTSIIGIYDWGKNKKNHDRFFEEFENSLII